MREVPIINIERKRNFDAMRRPRGPGGRFLTAEEVAEIEKNKGADGKDDDSGDVPEPKTGSKRKSEAGSTDSNKKAKTEPDDGDEDDDEDAEDDS